MKHAVDFTNPRDVRAWLDELRARVEEVLDLGDEAARPRCKRVLARGALRRELEATRETLDHLLRAGRRGLTRGGRQ